MIDGYATGMPQTRQTGCPGTRGDEQFLHTGPWATVGPGWGYAVGGVGAWGQPGSG